MHIVFLCNEYPPSNGGGIGIFTQTLARHLVKSGYKASVIGGYHIREELVEIDQGVQIIRMPINTTPVINLLINKFRVRKRLTMLNTTTPVDIVEGSEIELWGLSSEIPGIKILRMHGGHHFFSVTLGNKPKPGRGYLERLSFHNADYLCAVSKFVAETTRELLGLGSRSIEVIPNSVNVHLFKPLPDVKEESGSILFVGAITEKKGIRQLIQAMSMIKQAKPLAHLYIVGRDTIDKNTGESYTRNLMSTIPIELLDSIHFVGPVQNAEVADRIARAQVCVYPSHMEAQGIVVIEAMSAGKAVVASQTGPGPELIKDGIDGLLCDPYSPVSIAEKIITLLENEDLRKKLSINARKRAMEQFSTEVLIEKNIEFYKKCLAR